MIEYESLTYYNSKNESILFGIGSDFHVNVQKDVSGISDLNNTIYSSSSMNQNGDTFVGTRIEPRQIEIDGKIRDMDKGVQLTLRRAALKILNPELDGYLVYQYGDYMRRIGAKVKGSPRFTHPDLTQEFSIVFECLDPFWREIVDDREEIAEWTGAWQFPIAIEQNDPVDMEFGRRRTTLIVDITNRGDVATGMKIEFRALGVVENPYLYNINTQQIMRLNYTMAGGDIITVDGSYGHKSITLDRGGVESNLFRYMDPESVFLDLDVGDSTFRYGADSGETDMEVTIYYAPKYLGV